jgi:hypothetical protein
LNVLETLAEIIFDGVAAGIPKSWD